MEEGEVVRPDEHEAHDHQRGQGLAEYALILGLIAIVAIAALLFLGGTINDLMQTIGDTIDTNT